MSFRTMIITRQYTRELDVSICDECKVVGYNSMGNNDIVTTPKVISSDEWYTVYNESIPSIVFHFCTKKCAASWFQENW